MKRVSSKYRKIFIIAEAGINHNGDVKIACRMVDAAVKAGADAVKFQTFKADRVVSKFAPKAEYQKKAVGEKESHLEMARKWELDEKAHIKLRDYCDKRGVIFLSSPFDLESIDLLDKLGMKMLKIPSGEITNLPYLRKIGRLKKKIILSTGMSSLKEVKDALDILVKFGTPKKNITLLQCNSAYPTLMDDANLSAMVTMKDNFKMGVGYSDHTIGVEVGSAAAALGAVIIEKHFTLDRNMKGPDHKASLEPAELKVMVKAIRNIEKALGNGVKRPSSSELKNRAIARKSITAFKAIKRGETFTEENITVKRPAKGINPMNWDRVMGRRAKRDFGKDDLIEL